MFYTALELVAHYPELKVWINRRRSIAFTHAGKRLYAFWYAELWVVTDY